MADASRHKANNNSAAQRKKSGVDESRYVLSDANATHDSNKFDIDKLRIGRRKIRRKRVYRVQSIGARKSKTFSAYKVLVGEICTST